MHAETFPSWRSWDNFKKRCLRLRRTKTVSRRSRSQCVPCRGTPETAGIPGLWTFRIWVRKRHYFLFGKEHHGPNASSRIRSSGMTSSRGRSRFGQSENKACGDFPTITWDVAPQIWRTRMRSPKGNCLVSFHSWISILLPVYPQNWPTLNSLILLKVNTLLFCYAFNMEMCTNQLQMQGM